MDCFPLDEEIQGSIPFSNNSVVLAASALLQRLVSYADERNLQSVDVLLSSIWLLLREERGRERELASGLPYNTNVQSPIKRTPLETTKCKCLHTEAIKKTLPEITTQRKYLHAETQTDDRITETHSLISEKIVNQRKQDDDKSRKLVCPLDGSLDSFHITNVGRRKRVCSNADSTSNDKEDKDRVSNTAKIQPFVTEIAHLDGDRIISGNKLFGLNEVQNHVLDKAGTDLTAVDSTCTSKSRLLESVFESPPVLSPIKAITIPKEPSDDNLLSKSDTKDKAQNSNLPSAVIEGYSNDVNSAITETGAAPHKGLETIVNTSDSNIFQISSNDGLTYESIMIENVGSEDSDTQMTIDYDDPKVDSTKTSMKLSLDNDNITQHKYEKKGKTEQKQLVRNSHQNFAAIHNCALDVATNADIVIENLETGPPEPSVRESFGGIVEPDSDSELKIINIAGGVTFYDDPDQDDLPNDGNIDYVEKPGVSVYNPFVYSGFPSNQSSNTSPYSDVVYSSYTSFPSTYMNPRLTVQNCPQYFFPNNLNMGMYVGANEAGQIYQPVDNQTKYGNIPPSFNQGFQYYFPQPKKTDLSEPVEVKSETRAITATSPKSTKKKRKKELEEEPLSPNKEYYNVRDKNGKFIKMEEMPYINNVNHSSFSLKGHKPGMKNPVNQEQKAGGLFDDANCSFARLMRPLSRDGQSMKVACTSDQDEVKLHVRQLQKECKETNEKLKALYAKNGTTSKKDMTEKEKNRHKTLEKRQTSLLKKLRSLKRKLRKYEKLEYVVRDKGTFVNSSGLSEEYTVVTVKGLVSNSVGTEQSCSKFDQETVKTHYDQSNLANSKKTFSLKESKGKKMLKKSSELDKGKVKPLGSSNSKIKTAKQKLAAKKILKIKKAKTRQILKESAGKKKLKLKHAVNKESESDSPAGKGVSTVTAEVVKKRGRGRPKKGEEKNPGKLKVNSLPNITKTGKKTKAIAQLKQARKEKEQQEVKEILIAAYHGERGAKLAAQQKISAYNESLSLDSAAKGEN